MRLGHGESEHGDVANKDIDRRSGDHLEEAAIGETSAVYRLPA